MIITTTTVIQVTDVFVKVGQSIRIPAVEMMDVSLAEQCRVLLLMQRRILLPIWKGITITISVVIIATIAVTAAEEHQAKE
jgi:hypothetical protein